ncbi:MAG: GDP-mannose 4,6-dehydratase [Candidatus Saccharimonadales bacterium]
MQKKVLITGVNGFVGEHVAREFNSRGYKVVGLGHDDVAHSKVLELLESYIKCNLLNETDVKSKLDQTNISAVIHLAGLANVGESFDQPERYMTANGIMTHNVLSKVMSDSSKARVVVVSTGALYNPSQPLPLTELSKTFSNSPYAVGKLMCEDVVEYYRGRGLDAITVRPFNHIGPGQLPGFILPDLYDQIIDAKNTGKISIGNLETKRDYTDVRDIARAYADLALAQTLEYPLYNVCSGKSLSGKEILETLQISMNVQAIEVLVDQQKIRPNDIADIRGDSTRIHQELGWKPEIGIQQTIEDFVESKTS